MDRYYSADLEPATPEYVLAVRRDQYRQQCQPDREGDSRYDPTFASTVADWRNACDLLPWRGLARAYNRLWDIDVSDANWQSVLEPAGERRLKEVCRLVASRATRPRVRPARFFGRTCPPAGVFLTVRSLLSLARAPRIAPSTRLAPYARQHLDVFLGPVSWLAPGTLPPSRARKPGYEAAVWGFAAGLGRPPSEPTPACRA